MISIRNLCIELGDFVLRDACLDIEDREYMVIVGPSGSGKTVLLESIAGLYPVKRGEVWLRGCDATVLKPEHRHVSIVYQDYSLFTHISAEKNILFGMRMRGMEKDEMKKSLDKMVDLFNISHLLSRKPSTLSGGEQQKIALARALCVSPDVLLLDEPLSSLDPGTREDIEQELRNLHRELTVTILHVTHNFEEAIALGDRIAVIGGGKIMQVGTPEDIFRRPNSEFVARFAMARNIFYGRVVLSDRGDHMFKTGDSCFLIEKGRKGDRMVIRPEDIMVYPFNDGKNNNGKNCFPGTINRINDKGSTLFVDVDIGIPVTALVTRHACRESGLRTGMRVKISCDPGSLHIFQE